MSRAIALRRVRLVTVDMVHETPPDAPQMLGPDPVAAVARAILPSDREGFAVLHLDTRHRVRSVELVSIGSLGAAIVHPREVFKAAMLANAAAVILAHNHPSGDPEPSLEDFEITRRLLKAGEILGVAVLDHVIIAGDRCYSMLAHKQGGF